MTYRELLLKYKEGTLTEEERLLIEQEIEKSEAINDYLAEEIEETIGLNLVEKNVSVSNEESKKLEQSIKSAVNRRFAKVLIGSVGCVFIILLIIRFAVSPIVASQYYDPTKKTGGQEYNEDLSFDLRAITEVSMPGYSMNFVANAEDLGFGKYNLMYTRKNSFTKERESVRATINKGRRVGSFEDFYARDYFAFTEFWNYEEGSAQYMEVLTIQKNFSGIEREHLSKLLSTSYVSAWVRFSKDLTMEELSKLKQEYAQVDFKWIAIRTAEKQGQQLMGFTTDPNDGLVSSDKVDEQKYPGFELVDILGLSGATSYENPMAKIYETHFTSLLSYLGDHKEAVTALVGNSKNYDYKNALSYVKENGVGTYGALVYAEAGALIELYDSGQIMTLDIDNVIASKYIQ